MRDRASTVYSDAVSTIALPFRAVHHHPCVPGPDKGAITPVAHHDITESAGRLRIEPRRTVVCSKTKHGNSPELLPSPTLAHSLEGVYRTQTPNKRSVIRTTRYQRGRAPRREVVSLPGHLHQWDSRHWPLLRHPCALRRVVGPRSRAQVATRHARRRCRMPHHRAVPSEAERTGGLLTRYRTRSRLGLIAVYGLHGRSVTRQRVRFRHLQKNDRLSLNWRFENSIKLYNSWTSAPFVPSSRGSAQVRPSKSNSNTQKRWSDCLST